MKASYALVASVVLAGMLCAHAQDADVGASADGPKIVPEVATRSAQRAGDKGQGQSSLLSQANAVFDALRKQSGLVAEPEAVVVNVDIGDPVLNAASQSGNCQLMPIPGSRIRATRCYTPSEGELALNDYQFQQEIRQIREQQAIQTMQRSSYERALLETAQGIRPEQ